MAKTLITPAKFYKLLHRLADARIGRVERAFLNAIKVTVDEIDPARLDRALRLGDATGVMEAINLNGQLAPRIRSQYAAVLAEVFRRAGVAAEAQFPSTVNLRFDLVNQRAVNYARTKAAQLITNVTDDVRASVRRIIARGFRVGRTVDEMGREIRSLIGLTQPQATALENARLGLRIRLGMQNGTPIGDLAAELGISEQQAKALAWRSYRIVGRTMELSDELIADRAEKYSAKMVRYRARMIARSETIQSSAAGQQELWQQAADKGIIDVNTTVQTWIVTEDDRLCEVCAAIPGMNSDGVPLGGMFQTPVGPVEKPGDPHPQCRCAIALEFVTAQQQEAA